MVEIELVAGRGPRRAARARRRRRIALVSLVAACAAGPAVTRSLPDRAPDLPSAATAPAGTGEVGPAAPTLVADERVSREPAQRSTDGSGEVAVAVGGSASAGSGTRPAPQPAVTVVDDVDQPDPAGPGPDVPALPVAPDRARGALSLMVDDLVDDVPVLAPLRPVTRTATDCLETATRNLLSLGALDCSLPAGR